MKLSVVVVALSTIALNACAGEPRRGEFVAGPLAQQTDGDDRPTASGGLDKASPNASLPTQELTGKLLYQILLAEIAAQRGRTNVAVTTYLEVAKATRDPRIAQRATELAMYGRMPQQALEASTIWSDADPQSQQARQIMASLLLSTGKLDQAQMQLKKYLAGEEADVKQSFMSLNSLLARHPDKAAALAMMRSLAEPFGQLPEAHYAVAVAAMNAKDTQLALSEVKRAQELRTDWEPAAQLEGQILQQTNPARAAEFYTGFLTRNPKANEVRMSFARLLADQKNYSGARDQFNELVKHAPNNPDISFAIGLLSMQLQDYPSAESYFTKSLGQSPRDPDMIRMYLGQVAEDQKHYDKAAEWYKQVTTGEQAMNAQIKYAGMLFRQNKLDEARQHLQSIPVQSDQQKVQILLADANLLRDAKRFEEAYKALSDGLAKYPDALDLIYDRAMAAEKVDKIDVLEQDLRRLIQLKPDHAHAYNALGYTLADRNLRLPEALELIKKGLEISPDDPFIIDSLGWVYYKMGNLEEALVHLRKAFQARPDPEIAAHLGEVLWVQGSRTEADKIWRAAAEANPDNEVLNSIMKKFK